MKKKIGIVGSTGSIGRQAVDVILKNKDKFDVVFLSCNTNSEEIIKQIKVVKPKFAIILSGKINEDFIDGTKILKTFDDLVSIIRGENLDLILSAAVGFAGIRPTYEAIKSGIDVALANKEPIVSGGKILMRLAKEKNVKIIPVDSEHSAIFQCLMGQDKKKVHSITLTASGGPFIKRPDDSLSFVSVEETLKHPNWDMGAKITVDSATMMNKGLELIEAKYLFDVEPDMLNVVIHPQSIIHSFVSFIDGSTIAQMGYPDMKTPISFALGFPERIDAGVNAVDLAKIATLSFYEPDLNKYRCLNIAMKVMKSGSNVLMVVMNAANEVAVELFLKKRIRFTDIPDIVEKTVERFSPVDVLGIDEIFETDILARETCKNIYKKEYEI
ncbi:MAG: 1-deoxy-D-xylulose-5-phosphate reductoisomerase [Deferribacteres bacterium]|jgi:1-deoxy-D-xylulose-5-phosphate reductoisomerase|nr:1-deoxy-D-xylulose-5-phosphate reductoisomerase [Deferribacteres bacterium]